MKLKIWWKESLNSDGQQFHQYQQNEIRYEIYFKTYLYGNEQTKMNIIFLGG
jgi:hypothetical protein